MCDASDYAAGAVLRQRKHKKPYVIHYASRTLDSAQLFYDKERTTRCCVRFGQILIISCQIAIVRFIDHATLKYLLSKKDAKPRLIRWILLFNHQI